MDSPTSMFLGLVLGSIGFGFFAYGKKQKVIVPMICGSALMIFPYFVTNNIILVIVGGILMAVPYFVRL